MTGDFEGFGSSLKGVEVFQHSSAPSWSLLIAFSGILLCLTVDTDRKYGGAGERYACARGKTSNLENITYGMCHINTRCSVHSFCVLSLTGRLTAKVGFVLPYFLGNVLDLLLRTAQKKKNTSDGIANVAAELPKFIVVGHLTEGFWLKRER